MSFEKVYQHDLYNSMTIYGREHRSGIRKPRFKSRFYHFLAVPEATALSLSLPQFPHMEKEV